LLSVFGGVGSACTVCVIEPEDDSEDLLPHANANKKAIVTTDKSFSFDIVFL
jgi:hypothetical protein